MLASEIKARNKKKLPCLFFHWADYPRATRRNCLMSKKLNYCNSLWPLNQYSQLLSLPLFFAGIKNIRIRYYLYL